MAHKSSCSDNEEFTSQMDAEMNPVEDVSEEPELSDEKAKELLNTRIRPVFVTKRYRKVVTRNPHNGEWEVTYLPKRRKTWTSQSAAGFKKACEARAEKCKQRKQQRMQDQIAKLKAQLEELQDTTDGLDDLDEEEDNSTSELDEKIVPVKIKVHSPSTKRPFAEKTVIPKKKVKKD